MYIYVCMHMHVCIWIHVYAYMYMYMYMYRYVCMYFNMYICVYVCMYACMYMCIYMYIYVHSTYSTHTHETSVRGRVRMYPPPHMYIAHIAHTHTRTYTHTHKHTHWHVSRACSVWVCVCVCARARARACVLPAAKRLVFVGEFACILLHIWHTCILWLAATSLVPLCSQYMCSLCRMCSLYVPCGHRCCGDCLREWKFTQHAGISQPLRFRPHLL